MFSICEIWGCHLSVLAPMKPSLRDNDPERATWFPAILPCIAPGVRNCHSRFATALEKTDAASSPGTGRKLFRGSHSRSFSRSTGHSDTVSPFAKPAASCNKRQSIPSF